jgi:CelD/BcsL family acetyltransferase involved in cellulose biosynthesis
LPIRALFEGLRGVRDPAFGVVFSTVRLGERLAAGEIYLRAGTRLHAWISAFDRELGVYAPGHILTDRALDSAAAHGISQIDFGAGSDEYKTRWCLDAVPLGEGVMYASSLAGATRAAALGGWRTASAPLGGVNGVFQRARRRADHVFAVEGNWVGATIALALAAVARRHGLH